MIAESILPKRLTESASRVEEVLAGMKDDIRDGIVAIHIATSGFLSVTLSESAFRQEFRGCEVTRDGTQLRHVYNGVHYSCWLPFTNESRKVVL